MPVARSAAPRLCRLAWKGHCEVGRSRELPQPLPRPETRFWPNFHRLAARGRGRRIHGLLRSGTQGCQRHRRERQLGHGRLVLVHADVAEWIGVSTCESTFGVLTRLGPAACFCSCDDFARMEANMGRVSAVLVVILLLGGGFFASPPDALAREVRGSAAASQPSCGALGPAIWPVRSAPYGRSYEYW